MDKGQVVLAVRNGELDEDLDLIAAVIKARQNWLSAEAVYELNVGDTVKFVNIRPQYLQRHTGTVTEIDLNGRKGPLVKVDLGRRVGKYGPIVTAPHSTVKKVVA